MSFSSCPRACSLITLPPVCSFCWFAWRVLLLRRSAPASASSAPAPCAAAALPSADNCADRLQVHERHLGALRKRLRAASGGGWAGRRGRRRGAWARAGPARLASAARAPGRLAAPAGGLGESRQGAQRAGRPARRQQDVSLRGVLSAETGDELYQAGRAGKVGSPRQNVVPTANRNWNASCG